MVKDMVLGPVSDVAPADPPTLRRRREQLGNDHVETLRSKRILAECPGQRAVRRAPAMATSGVVGSVGIPWMPISGGHQLGVA